MSRAWWFISNPSSNACLPAGLGFQPKHKKAYLSGRRFRQSFCALGARTKYPPI